MLDCLEQTGTWTSIETLMTKIFTKKGGLSEVAHTAYAQVMVPMVNQTLSDTDKLLWFVANMTTVLQSTLGKASTAAGTHDLQSVSDNMPHFVTRALTSLDGTLNHLANLEGMEPFKCAQQHVIDPFLQQMLAPSSPLRSLLEKAGTLTLKLWKAIMGHSMVHSLIESVLKDANSAISTHQTSWRPC